MTSINRISAVCGLALTSITLAQQPPAQQPSSAQGVVALPGADAPPSSSLLVTTPVTQNPNNEREYEPHALRDVSMFAIAPPQPREFVEHDLVQIIVRETSAAFSTYPLAFHVVFVVRVNGFAVTSLRYSFFRWPET